MVRHYLAQPIDGFILAATTGVVAASVISMGLISLPIMLRYGYDRRLASGVIAASGTLAQIIPPSLVLIVLADQLGRSVGDMYTGAIIPGLVLTGLYVAYIFTVSILRPNWVPALPLEARTLGHGVTSLFVALAGLVVVQPHVPGDGTVAGPHPYPAMVRDFQAVIGNETKAQILELEGRLPDAAVACIGDDVHKEYAGLDKWARVVKWLLDRHGKSPKLARRDEP